MDTEKLINDLKQEHEMDPDKHDGCYELMREIVASYSQMTDYSVCNYLDMNAIYAQVIIKLNIEKKKEYIKDSNLSASEKERLIAVADKVYDNACFKKYENRFEQKNSVGMFGTGFYSFKTKMPPQYCQSFIRMLVDIAKMDDDIEMFDRAAQVLTSDYKGTASASASVILHCLKPYTFPIINGNMKRGTIFETLGIDIKKPGDIGTYIDNCREIKSFRDKNFSFKNYRILDLWARKIGAYTDESETEEETEMGEQVISYDRNMILYGPPGTGKTYNTVIYSVAIVEKKKIDELKKEAASDYKSVKKRYDAYLKEGKIAFTTFHQSYGYEEFIEGIKPNTSDDASKLEYSVEDGIFKEFCARASAPTKKDRDDYGLNDSPVVWKVSLAKTYDNPVRSECLSNNHIRIGWDSYGPDIIDDDYKNGGKTVLNAFINKMKIGDIVLSCYTQSTIDAIGVITGDCEWDDSFSEYKRVRKVKWLLKQKIDILEYNGGSNMTLSTVYKMKITANDVLKMLGKNTDDDPNEKKEQDNYVFIIDEINRGNISKIFGELITLIEDTKRIGADEEMKVRLPYSSNEKPFGVPSNVYILGTMNTADRSIAMMDTALRRRFSFKEMMPDSKVLKDINADKVIADGQTIDVAAMLDIINKRIEYLYDREHTIGHAFFTGLKNDPSIEHLSMIFEKSVIPLLQEYFYEDYAKIQLVLGDDGKKNENKKYQFILDTDIKVNEVFNTVPESRIDIPAKKYDIQKDAFKEVMSYKLIGKGI